MKTHVVKRSSDFSTGHMGGQEVRFQLGRFLLANRVDQPPGESAIAFSHSPIPTILISQPSRQQM